jgi:Asp-tRNA(Asn)/Glu-tRNA(Gln) amidotransferase C subunit
MTRPPRAFSAEALQYAARAARLDIPAERRQLVGATLEGIYALLDTLDSLPLDETPPATAFDARWES